MTLTQFTPDDGEKTLAELARLIAGHLLTGGTIVDQGTQLAFHGGSEDFREAVLMAVANAIGEMQHHKLLAMAIGKLRKEQRETGQRVLVDDDLPPGFSSN